MTQRLRFNQKSMAPQRGLVHKFPFPVHMRLAVHTTTTTTTDKKKEMQSGQQNINLHHHEVEPPLYWHLDHMR